MCNYNTGKEVWKTIRHNKNYEISNYGNVWSNHSNKLISRIKKDNGYEVASLWKNNKGKQYYIHRLVLEHFSDERQNETVNHRDGNKANNHVSNLEWMTYSENNVHALKNNLRKSNRNNKRMSKSVEQWCPSGKLIKVYPSMRQAERETGVDATSIGHGIRKGWRYGGYIWKYHNK